MANIENGWYISSTDDPTLTYVRFNSPDNGKYTFLPEAGGKTYVITYVEDGKSGTTTYTPNTEECNPCYKEYNFNGWAGPNLFESFPSTGATTSVTYNLGECWEVRVKNYNGNVTGVTTSTTSSAISVAKNVTAGTVRSDVIYEFKNKYIPTAKKDETVTIYQQGKCDGETTCPVVTPTTTAVTKDGGIVNVSFIADECWVLTKSLDKPGSVASFKSDKEIKVEANASSEPRTITATYKFSNPYNNTICDPQNVVITQEEGCDCNGVTYTTDGCITAFTYTGGTGIIGKLTSCDITKTTISATSGGDYLVPANKFNIQASSTEDEYDVSVTVVGNEARENAKHVKYVVYFKDQPCKPNSTGTPPYDLIIEPKGCTCDCNYLKRIDKDKPYFFPTKDTNPGRPTLTNQILKELVMKDGFSSHCTYEDLEPYAIDTGITRIWTAVTGNTIEIRGDIADITKEGEFKRALRFGLKVCGNDCNILNPPFYIFQRCYCGTDDCRNVYNIEGGGTVVEDHPMYVAGCVNDGWDDEDWPQTRFPYPQYPKGKYHSDADSIFVDTLYVIPKKLVDGELKPMYKTANNLDGKVRLCHKENGAFVSDISSCTYWPEDRLGNKPVLVTYNELNQPLGIDLLLTGSRPMIVVSSLIGAKTEGSPINVDIIYDEDNHHENVQMYLWRDDPTSAQTDQNTKWEVLLATDDETTKAGPNSGVTCCSEFITTIHQAKKGYRYNKDYRVDDMATLEECPQ